MTTVHLANSGIAGTDDAAKALVPTLMLLGLSNAWAVALGTGSPGTPWGMVSSMQGRTPAWRPGRPRPWPPRRGNPGSR
ncbi:hypothetical protein DQ353_07545 [Arthrobacter sp. AQ5-05]|uniref:hypothetical protein n=1 Tax=Arthrobacter sp. AQ5-05 TaxID=2184581 RepID=UPI000DCB3944|nr:hypothetical protein [Arthrobacter sp. AQ5-05]RAX49998.1 hypothetical protein DQ353_07545 [Arthrobacter sp. AQ5-05]